MINFNKFFNSKKFRAAIIVVASFAVLLFVFKVGVFVGYKKAQFSYRWGENYQRNFAGPRRGFLGDIKRGFGDKDFINAHGTFGEIIKIDTATSSEKSILIVKGKDDAEKTIIVSNKTIIVKGRDAVKIDDIKVDAIIAVIGSPNEQGQIEARLIRVFR